MKTTRKCDDQITLTNDYHNTSVTLLNSTPCARTFAKINRELCGLSDCVCGIIRGKQTPEAYSWLEDHYMDR